MAYDWENELTQWFSRYGISEDISWASVAFFQKVFENTKGVYNAWFGVHLSTISIIVYGIYLAAICFDCKDEGVWLLVDHSPLDIDGIEYRPEIFSNNPKYPLIWAYLKSISGLPGLISNKALWASFSRATEKYINSGRFRNGDSFHIDLDKGQSEESIEDEVTFHKKVVCSLRDDPWMRWERLKTAPVMPKRIKIVSTSFIRNIDVVAEVLYRANGK